MRKMHKETPDMAQKLFVGSLSFSSTSAGLRELFATSGTVLSAAVAARVPLQAQVVPVDEWAPVDLESMKQAVGRLRDRIAPDETWRMTVQKRGPGVVEPGPVIPTLAALIPARVDLIRPQKVLRVERCSR
jgi:hypothetical protein